MKNFKIALLALLIVGSIGTLFAFTKSNFVDVDFYFDPSVTQTDITIVDPGNWQSTPYTSPSCPTPLQKLCYVTFNTTQYPLVNGKPDFTNTTFANTIKAHRSTPADEGQTFNGITFHYRRNTP